MIRKLFCIKWHWYVALLLVIWPLSQNKQFIPGVWGPYWSAMVPGCWLTEGGQSATGALLDYLIENHAASTGLVDLAACQGVTVFELLNNLLKTMMDDLQLPFLSSLTKDIHVLPDFHGNRSPIADPKVKGVICGLTLDTNEKQLALLYLAAVQGIAYGTRHIVEHFNAHGCKIDTLHACGGLSKSTQFIQEHADITGCPIVLPKESESVLLGAAILGAVAARRYLGLREAMMAMNIVGQVSSFRAVSVSSSRYIRRSLSDFWGVVYPSSDPKVKRYHDAKYHIFRDLYEQQLSQRVIMAEALR